MTKSPSTTGRIVSVPMGAAQFIGRRAGYLNHAAELDAEGRDPIRVLCGRVKVAHLLPDSTSYDESPVDCPACRRALARVAP
ncbi:MAG: hypothetical protein E6Q97_23510 [Desulfurellales bacterium]|nr:MAG: hypothetical protein E6Q97_23510 [Desulfurellales bacterium]